MATLDPFHTLNSHELCTNAQPTPVVLARALGSSGQETTVTSDGVVFTETVAPGATSSSTGAGARHGVSQTVLEWIFAVIALSVLTALVLWRYCCVRHGRRSDTPPLPFSRPALRRPASALGRGQTRDRNGALAFLHSGLVPLDMHTASGAQGARWTRAQVRGLDVDTEGRRGGDATEELPPYEAGKRPPGYDSVSSPDVVQVGPPLRRDGPTPSQSEPPGSAPSDILQDAPAHPPGRIPGDMARDLETPPSRLESAAARGSAHLRTL